MKKTIKNLIGLGIALVLLITCGLIGGLSGIFKGFSDMTGTIHLNGITVLKALIVILILLTVHYLVQLIFSFFSGKKGRAGTLITVFASLIKYALVIIGICWVLTIIGVNVSTIVASLGIIALILGFGAESLIADLVTGIFILFENQFNIGDIIEVGGFRGVVETIGVRTTSLRDMGGNIKIINNSDLTNIINRSNCGSVAVCQVGVSYETDLEILESKLVDILAQIKAKYPTVFIGAVEYLGVEDLADSNVMLKFKADVHEKDIFHGRRLLNKELKCAFDRAGITIAYPQLDVHTK